MLQMVGDSSPGETFYDGIRMPKINFDISITFGMIVFNGEPFVKYNLAAVYPIAHQIIAVEGACLSSASVAGPDGHSTDGTLETLYNFKRELDPDHKVIIVTAIEEGYADGFWPEKDEMSRAYAKKATGNYLWQLDSDEFYHEQQLSRFMDILRTKRPDMVSFPMITFWGGPDYIVDSFFLIRDKHDQIPRVFAWGPGYTYETHRPATVLDEQGIDLRKKSCLAARDLKRMHIYMYHYALLFPHQVYSKVRYYKNLLNSCIDTWEESVFLHLEKPFRAHNVYQHIGWLERFKGDHPAAIRAMMADIQKQTVKIEQRDCADVEKLLAKRHYRIATALLRTCARIMGAPPFYFLYRAYKYISRRIRAMFRLIQPDHPPHQREHR
jgi:glycosyltransferase involved in cell wall biosynthesis